MVELQSPVGLNDEHFCIWELLDPTRKSKRRRRELALGQHQIWSHDPSGMRRQQGDDKHKSEKEEQQEKQKQAEGSRMTGTMTTEYTNWENAIMEMHCTSRLPHVGFVSLQEGGFDGSGRFAVEKTTYSSNQPFHYRYPSTYHLSPPGLPFQFKSLGQLLP